MSWAAAAIKLKTLKEFVPKGVAMLALCRNDAAHIFETRRKAPHWGESISIV